MSNPFLATGKVDNTKVQSKSLSLNCPQLLLAYDLDLNFAPSPEACALTHGKHKSLRVLPHTAVGNTHQ